MYAERLMLETDVTGKLMKMPKLPPNKQLEAIFLVISENVAGENVRRTPHSDIAGKTKIIGDVFDSVPAASWNLSK
ncbi:MAG: hypothetical protein NTY60_01980 [Proteobacteria bacterium]|nr:hypothetical protein [Pseudomonadota bacterium]